MDSLNETILIFFEQCAVGKLSENEKKTQILSIYRVRKVVNMSFLGF